MFAFIFASALIGAQAFVPITPLRNSALKMSFENELGVVSPTGFFDPLGLTNGMDAQVHRSHILVINS
jgi:hypothetical protein